MPINRTLLNLAIMPMKSRVLCCSNNLAAVADAYSHPLQMKKKQISYSSCHADEEVTIETTPSSIVDKEQVQPSRPLFRVPSLASEDFEDMLCLKRANPVYDEDDEEYPLSKRQRRVDERDDEEDAAQLERELSLCWGDRLVVDSEEEGYVILFQEH